jgi:hypothetical protein
MRPCLIGMAGLAHGLTGSAFVALIRPPFSPFSFTPFFTMDSPEDLNAIDTEALKGRLGQLRRYL